VRTIEIVRAMIALVDRSVDEADFDRLRERQTDQFMHAPEVPDIHGEGIFAGQKVTISTWVPLRQVHEVVAAVMLEDYTRCFASISFEFADEDRQLIKPSFSAICGTCWRRACTIPLRLGARDGAGPFG
jgi:hypothetical protein